MNKIEKKYNIFQFYRITYVCITYKPIVNILEISIQNTFIYTKYINIYEIYHQHKLYIYFRYISIRRILFFNKNYTHY